MLKALNAEDRGAIFENTILFTYCPKRWYTEDIWPAVLGFVFEQRLSASWIYNKEEI